MLVNLISNDKRIKLTGKSGNELQFTLCKHFACRVARIAENQGFRAMLCKCLPECNRIKGKIRWMQWHIDRNSSGQDGIGSIIFIERRKDHNLVARIAAGHHGSHHRLGTAASNNHIGFRVNGNSHES